MSDPQRMQRTTVETLEFMVFDGTNRAEIDAWLKEHGWSLPTLEQGEWVEKGDVVTTEEITEMRHLLGAGWVRDE